MPNPLFASHTAHPELKSSLAHNILFAVSAPNRLRKTANAAPGNGGLLRDSILYPANSPSLLHAHRLSRSHLRRTCGPLPRHLRTPDYRLLQIIITLCTLYTVFVKQWPAVTSTLPSLLKVREKRGQVLLVIIVLVYESASTIGLAVYTVIGVYATEAIASGTIPRSLHDCFALKPFSGSIAVIRGPTASVTRQAAESIACAGTEGVDPRLTQSDEDWDTESIKSDQTPDASDQTQDASDQTPDASDQTPDASDQTPDASDQTSDDESELNNYEV